MNPTPHLRRSIATAIVALCAMPLVAPAASREDAIRRLVDATIVPLMRAQQVPGMAVALTIDGQSYHFNYGLASREKNVPVTEATLFELGSISKTFTATLASYAQVQGKLSLADHPGKLMPTLEGYPINRASLLELGTYTAGGLPLQFPEEIADAGVTAYFQQWQPDAAPGVQRRYSNPSIGLLGQLTGLALERDLGELMQTVLFPRLGLKHTYVHVPASAMGNYAWGYDQDQHPIRMNPGVLWTPAYGVKSTSADMLRYLQANLDSSQLDAGMQRAVAGTQLGYFAVGPMVQGLGWEQYTYPTPLTDLLDGNSYPMIEQAHPARRLTPPTKASSHTLFNKTGSTSGFGAYVAFSPIRKIGIVLLANKNYPIPARVSAAHAILQQVSALPH